MASRADSTGERTPRSAASGGKRRRWASRLRALLGPPLPGGPVLRTLVAVSAIIYTWGDLSYIIRLQSPLEAAVSAVLYLPVFMLAFSVRLAAILWILVAAVSLLVTPAVTPQLVATSVVAIVLNAIVSFTLSHRESSVFWTAFVAYIALHAVLMSGGFQVLVVVGSLFLLAGLMGRFLASYRRRWERELDRVKRLKQVQKEVRAEERTVIAHELHDVIAHDITAITMQARRARFVDAAKRDQILELIGDAGQSALGDLRRLLLVLRRIDEAHEVDQGETLLDDAESSKSTAGARSTDFSDSVEQVVEALRGAGMEVDFEITGDVGAVPTVLQKMLRRMVREIGTNILKHGEPGSPVEVQLEIAEGGISVRTRNRVGASVTAEMSSGMGIEAMKTRVDAYGGTASMGATADNQWDTRVWVPFSPVM